MRFDCFDLFILRFTFVLLRSTHNENCWICSHRMNYCYMILRMGVENRWLVLIPRSFGWKHHPRSAIVFELNLKRNHWQRKHDTWRTLCIYLLSLPVSLVCFAICLRFIFLHVLMSLVFTMNVILKFFQIQAVEFASNGASVVSCASNIVKVHHSVINFSCCNRSNPMFSAFSKLTAWALLMEIKHAGALVELNCCSTLYCRFGMQHQVHAYIRWGLDQKMTLPATSRKFMPWASTNFNHVWLTLFLQCDTFCTM